MDWPLPQRAAAITARALSAGARSSTQQQSRTLSQLTMGFAEVKKWKEDKRKQAAMMELSGGGNPKPPTIFDLKLYTPMHKSSVWNTQGAPVHKAIGMNTFSSTATRLPKSMGPRWQLPDTTENAEREADEVPSLEVLSRLRTQPNITPQTDDAAAAAAAATDRDVQTKPRDTTNTEPEKSGTERHALDHPKDRALRTPSPSDPPAASQTSPAALPARQVAQVDGSAADGEEHPVPGAEDSPTDVAIDRDRVMADLRRSLPFFLGGGPFI
ncbi:hypothetical protein VTK56DRAFT_1715 [Thermocarpiscus australiensis]